MVQTVGSLLGAAETGILDATTYMSGLSGSTWALTPWVLSGLDIVNYRELLKKNINQKPASLVARGVKIPSASEYYAIAKQLMKKVAYGQTINFVDIYGALLANMLFTGIAEKYKTDKQTLGLSALQKNLESGRLYPMPILTALETSEAPLTKWFEFTPYEIGTSYPGMNAFIPTWALGRTFENGTSTSRAPEQSAGFCLGIFGSAFGIDVWGLLHEAADIFSFLPTSVHQKIIQAVHNDKVQKKLNAGRNFLRETEGIISSKPYRALGFSLRDALGAPIANFTYKMENQLMANKKKFMLVDGGHELKAHPAGGFARHNLAVQPSLNPRRSVDIQILCDASADIDNAPALGAAATRALSDTFPFPTISSEQYKKASKNVVTIFGENDPTVPTVAYIPGRLTKEVEPFTKTINFNYSPEQVDMLSNLTKSYFIQSIDAIKNAIVSHIRAKARALGMQDPFASQPSAETRSNKKYTRREQIKLLLQKIKMRRAHQKALAHNS